MTICMKMNKNETNTIESICSFLDNSSLSWKPPVIEDVAAIPKGDMPGDKIQIHDDYIKKATVLFPELESVTIFV